MKIQNVRDVKMRLNRIIKELPKNGLGRNHQKRPRPCAALLPVTEETDLEALALTHNERFWRMFDAASRVAKKRDGAI